MPTYYRLFFILLSSITISLSSCNSGNSKKKVGFLIRTYQLDRCVKERDFFSEKIAELKAEVMVANADNNDQLQIKQGLEMIEKGIDVLVIFPVNGNTLGPLIREAHKKNVPTIAYESLIENCDVDYFVTADNKKGGELMTQHVTSLVPKGNYVLLGGDKADRNAILIKNGQHKIIDPLVKNGDIKVIYDIYADWNAAEGYHETMQVLKLSGIIPDAILSSNDGLATGVIKALDEYGLTGKVLVTGLDGELSAFQRIAKGTQSVTIFKSFKKQASIAAEMAVDLANGKKLKNTNITVFNKYREVPTCLIEPIAVDKKNLGEIIIKGNVFSKQEIYGN
jgi:D-xylose transport system substrate-binding protein